MHYVASFPDRVKLIFWDGSGVVLVTKRLEKGHFHWPEVRDGVMRLIAAQFAGAARGAGMAAGPRAAAHSGAERGELSARIGEHRRSKSIALYQQP